jgi:hypothetical protein
LYRGGISLDGGNIRGKIGGQLDDLVGYLYRFSAPVSILEEKRAPEIMLFGGGVIPLSDVKELKRLYHKLDKYRKKLDNTM